MSNLVRINNLLPAENDAWYRNFYVWLIIFLPACAVAASFATLYIAAKNPPDLVVDDYANIESTIAKNMSQDNVATALALRAKLIFGNQNATDTLIDLHLQANKQEVLPSSVLLRIVHSTQAEQDADAELTGIAGHYSGSIKLPSGSYNIYLVDGEGTWRLTTRVSGQPRELLIEAPGQF